ncbi:AP2 domain-containing protein, partial [Streptococcus suis]
MTSKVDLAGQRFERLVAIKPVIKNGRQAWLCQCDCGNTKIVRADHLQSGAVKSCGCLNAEKKKERFKDMTDFENDNFKVLKKA